MREFVWWLSRGKALCLWCDVVVRNERGARTLANTISINMAKQQQQQQT